MAALTIRNVEEAIKTQLRLRAARNGVSMEEEARRILREVLLEARDTTPMGQRLLSRFGAAGSEDFVTPERHKPRTPPAWDVS